MSKTKPGTVAESGAKSGALLEGAEPANSGMLIQVKEEQRPGHTGWVQGSFKLLAAGGFYMSYLSPYVNKTFTAAELIRQVAPKVGKKNLHILNCNMLKLSRKTSEVSEAPAKLYLKEQSSSAVSETTLSEASVVVLKSEETISYSEAVSKPDALRDIEQHLPEYRGLESTERLSIIKSRIGQGPFRDSIIRLWGSCSVTGFANLTILRASHAKPWRDSTNQERLDPFNGLLLIPNLDALFDLGLITFGSDGQIIISKWLSQEERLLLMVKNNLRLRKMFPNNQKYLAYHREEVFTE